MITEDQTAVIEFLAAQSTHGGATVERMETHGSIVFLTGERAYKLKRAIRFDYLDFSTSARRRTLCEAEVRLNRRTAPALYLGVLPVMRQADGSFSLGGDGTPVDWVVEMSRFPQDALLDRLATAGQLALDVMPLLASAIAKFHTMAERRTDHGGQAGLSWVIEGNAAGFKEFGRPSLDPETSHRVIDSSRREFARLADALERRRQDGFVRQCHGDLHLRNIVLLDGQPTLFDGVEFNDEISCIDVLYDFAFLLMDLWRRRLRRHASVVWNRYLTDTEDLSDLSLIPLFLSCRAAVRAKTSATAASLQQDPERRRELYETSREYLAMAEQLLRPPRASLIATGGLSGSGKSTLALGLAPIVGAVPGAVVLRSDEIRKRLCGVGLLERLGPAGYSPVVSERVYTTLAERAASILKNGHSAIVDAVYIHPADRQMIERVAAAASVPFLGIWLNAPESTLIGRAEQRRNDPSDADAAVIRTQHTQDIGDMTWHRLDAGGSAESVLRSATNHLRDNLQDALNSAEQPAR